jgi:hypothetical protein
VWLRWRRPCPETPARIRWWAALPRWPVQLWRQANPTPASHDRADVALLRPPLAGPYSPYGRTNRKKYNLVIDRWGRIWHVGPLTVIFPKAIIVQSNGLLLFPQLVFPGSFSKSHSSQQLFQKPQLNQVLMWICYWLKFETDRWVSRLSELSPVLSLNGVLFACVWLSLLSFFFFEGRVCCL